MTLRKIQERRPYLKQVTELVLEFKHWTNSATAVYLIFKLMESSRCPKSHVGNISNTTGSSYLMITTNFIRTENIVIFRCALWFNFHKRALINYYVFQSAIWRLQSRDYALFDFFTNHRYLVLHSAVFESPMVVIMKQTHFVRCISYNETVTK